MTTSHDIAAKILDGRTLCDGEIVLDLEGYKLALRSNSEALLEKLGIYFAHCLGTGPAQVHIIALDCETLDLGIEFTDWKREPGKTGRKDAYYNLEDGRLIQKVRTGMVFLQSDDHLIAAGPSLANDNQVINYVNAQYMNHLQQNGALICHAAALVGPKGTLGLAGFSGGGKSTLMLHLMEESRLAYLTNDRLFIQEGHATGIPKLPRVNPGTLMNNATLRDILPEERKAELEKLPTHELWEIEEKYDVFVEDVYGEGKIKPKADLQAFLILHWSRTDESPCTIKAVDINERRDLLGAIMKSPGPFYVDETGRFWEDEDEHDEEKYIAELNGITVYEAAGGVDFKAAEDFCLKLLCNGEKG